MSVLFAYVDKNFLLLYSVDNFCLCTILACFILSNWN